MLKFNDKVKVVRGHEGAGLNEGGIFTVVCVIRAGSVINYMTPLCEVGPDSIADQDLVILWPKESLTYPYLWDANRFVLIPGG